MRIVCLLHLNWAVFQFRSLRAPIGAEKITRAGIEFRVFFYNMSFQVIKSADSG